MIEHGEDVGARPKGEICCGGVKHTHTVQTQRVYSIFLTLRLLLICFNHQEEISDRFFSVTLVHRHIDNLKSITLHTDSLHIVH